MMKYVAALTAALCLNAAANLMMKIGAQTIGAKGGLLAGGWWAAVQTIAQSRVLVTGLVCFFLNALLYLYALQSPSLKISIAYPVMVGGGYAIIAVVARFHPKLGESLSPWQMAGVLLVLSGIFLIAWSGSDPAAAQGAPR